MKDGTNSANVSDEAAKLAKELGIDLDDSDSGTDEKESNSSTEKTDTEVTEEESRGDDSEKEKKETVDYALKFKESAKEVQTKYIPMEKKVKALEEKFGKNIDDILGNEDQKVVESEVKEKDTSNVKDEVAAKVLTMEQELKTIKEQVSSHESAAQIAAREKKEAFQKRYDVDNDYFDSKIKPMLVGISKMTKENGEPYKLEEGLEMAYLLANRDNIENIVEKKAKILKKESELGGFSPLGSKQSSSIEKAKYSEQQQTVAEKFGVKLD